MRKVLVLGMCLALGLQGLAQARVVTALCPIQTSEHVKAGHVPNTVQACCNDTDSTTKTSKFCKMGHACPMASVWLTSSQSSWVPLRTAVPAVCSSESFARCIDPGSLWRPPALS